MSIRNTILDNLKTALEAVKDDATYDINIHRVSLFDENVLMQKAQDLPLVVILDTGKESLIYDGTNYRYRLEIVLRGVIDADTSSGVTEQLNNMVATLKKFVDSEPSLGSNALKFRIAEVVGNRYDEDKKLADTIVRCELVYWCVAGTF